MAPKAYSAFTRFTLKVQGLVLTFAT